MPAVICCTDELMLIKLPRLCGVTVEVIIVVAGTQRPLDVTKKTVVTISASGKAVLGRFVNVNTGINVNRANIINTRGLPIRSASLPIIGEVNIVTAPPNR